MTDFSRTAHPGARSETRGSAASLLAQARTELVEAATEPEPEPRYARAHLAALRAAAAVLAQRSETGIRPRRRGLRSAWDLLIELAPELGEWAGFFAAGAGKRAAAEAGLIGSVTPREADDLIREVATFCRLVERVTAATGSEHRPSASEVRRERGSIDRAPAREERTERCAQRTRRSDRAERPRSRPIRYGGDRE